MDFRLIVFDDDPDLSAIIRSALRSSGLDSVQTTADPSLGVTHFQTPEPYDVALIQVDIMMGSGQELLAEIKKKSPTTECIAIAGSEDKAAAIQCLRDGAYACLLKPFTREELVSVVRRALERKRLLDILQAERCSSPPALANPSAFKGIITNSRGFLRVLKAADLHAAGDGPILITGEGGTGKKLLAKAIHDASCGAEAPFRLADAAAWHEKNAPEDLRGLSGEMMPEIAPPAKNCRHGTLLLDEIADLTIGMQGRLIDFLKGMELSWPATDAPEKTDVRLIATTKADLASMVGAGRFRGDLFYRLRVNWLHLPPLRERREDISPLSRYFMEKWGLKGRAASLDASATAALEAYEFPGNLHELQAVLREAVESAQGKEVAAVNLPARMRRAASVLPVDLSLGNPALSLPEVEKQHILSVYRQLNSNKVRAARALGVGLNTLRRKLKAYDAA